MEDLNLRESEIQSLSSIDAVAALFASLGYNVERLQQTPAALGITNETLTRNIQHIEQIAVQDDELYIYLFVMKSMRVADRQALAKTFRNADGEFLLVLTADYESIDFVLLERVLPRDSAGNPMTRKEVLVQQHVLTVKRRNPGRVALRVLRRFTYTEADVFYQIDKLLSAYTVAQWSRPMFNNLALFSDYFLEHRLQDTDEWHENALSIHNRLSSLFTNVRGRLGNAREEQTRADLLEPIFQELGFTWTERQSSGDEVQPDYMLAAGGDDHPLAYALTYRWNRYLDGRDMAAADGFDTNSLDGQKYDDNPGARVVSLLAVDDAPPYIIVTNGKIWRIYAKEAHSRATNYYEIDLEETLTDPDRDIAMRYFWLFFRGGAFVRGALCFLDRVMAGSADYAKELEDRLKERVFEQIFPQFAAGFIRDGWGTETPTQDELDAVYQATLTFLYRMMFLLYAEARDLLPIKEARGYAEISLKGMKEEIAHHAKDLIEQAGDRIKAAYSASSTALYDRLTRLFTVIDKGDAALNVPNYNGGLFVTDPADDDPSPDASNARFLRDTKIPDRYLALGIDRLARDLEQRPGGGLVAIDYKSLGVRQLGSIYEGLLEFKLRIAPEKMAIIRGKRTEEVVPYKQAKKADIVTIGRGADRAEKTLSKGEVYLENTKQERKATGSYYTPDYIVKYIVAHTVGPVLEAKFAALTPRLREAEKRYYQSRRNNDAKGKAGMATQNADLLWDSEDMQTLAADVLDVKVLDPAMGSGHFLVEVVDFVTDRTLQFLDRFRYNPVEAQLQRVRESILNNMDAQGVNIDEKRLTDVNLLKRQVLKRCVYGVDLNRMAVELAKVSLWLDAFTLGAPLSFLDHHLRWGNSLIGTMARDADRQLRGAGGQLTLFSGPFVGLLQAAEVMRGVSALADATIEEAHQSAAMFDQFEEAARPYKQLLDVFVIQHFGVKQAAEFLTVYGADVMTAQRGKVAKEYQTVLDERERLYSAYRFFHWDLEFPEVFIDLSRAEWKDNGGFDAVVGNPPYGIVFDDVVKNYLESEVKSFVRNNDLYSAFMQIALRLGAENGSSSMIVPNTFILGPYFNELKKFLLENSSIEFILDFGYIQVFDDPNVFSAIYTASSMTTPDNTETLIADVIVKNQSIIYQNEISVNLNTLPLERWRPLHEASQKAMNGSITVDDLCYVKDVGFNYWTIGRGKKRGNSIGSRVLYSGEKQSPDDIPYVKGSDFDQYTALEFGQQWLRANYEEFLDPDIDVFRYSPEFLQVPEKLVYRQTADRISASIDTNQVLVDKTVHVILFRDKNQSLELLYLLAILNSQLTNFIYGDLSREGDRTFAQVKTFRVKQLPIRKIDFTTPQAAREQLTDQIVGAYSSGDHAGVLKRVKAVLHAKQTDVVHDVLAHLAQQMIDLNKQKQAEVKRFLGWLEGQIGANVDELSGKTIIQGYLGDYQKGEGERPFEDVLAQLTKGANRRKMGVNIMNATLQGKIRVEYEQSLDVLRPIKARLQDTDALIDQIVYRLYGLTDAEIAIVEGRGGGHGDE